MVWISDTLWCDGCGVEISWTPVCQGHHHYCCSECAEGRECECAAWVEQDEERRLNGAQWTEAAGYSRG